MEGLPNITRLPREIIGYIATFLYSNTWNDIVSFMYTCWDIYKKIITSPQVWHTVRLDIKIPPTNIISYAKTICLKIHNNKGNVELLNTYATNCKELIIESPSSHLIRTCESINIISQSALSRLEAISIVYCYSDAFSNEFIQKCNNLRKLKVYGYSTGFYRIDCLKLEVLKFYDDTLFDVFSLYNLPHLRILCMPYCIALAAIDFRKIPNLKRADISKTIKIDAFFGHTKIRKIKFSDANQFMKLQIEALLIDMDITYSDEEIKEKIPAIEKISRGALIWTPNI
jgi:hypothetical protein